MKHNHSDMLEMKISSQKGKVRPHYRKIVMLLAVIMLFVSVDQASKIWILNWFSNQNIVSYNVTSFLDFYLAYNYGISYSLLSSSEIWVRYALIAVQSIIIIVLFAWLLKEDKKREKTALLLIIGGAIGNLIDRIYHGGVVDFIFFHYGKFQWYIFNVADVFITLGAILLIYSFFINKKT